MLAIVPALLGVLQLPLAVHQLPMALPLLYDRALTLQPLPTRIATAATLAVTGDALAQRRDGQQRYELRRAASFVIVESLYRGVLQQPIFGWIVNTFRGSLLHTVAPVLSMPAAATLERVIFNQFVVSPGLYYPLYFALTGPMQGLNLRQTVARARQHFANLFGFNLCFWFPIQLVQFAFVPRLYKVPFICLAGLVWNIILSNVAGSVREWRRRNEKRAEGAALHGGTREHVAALERYTEHVAAPRADHTEHGAVPRADDTGLTGCVVPTGHVKPLLRKAERLLRRAGRSDGVADGKAS